MICAACRHENRERAKFCLECGARLAPSSPQRGTELPSGAKFGAHRWRWAIHVAP